MVTKSAFLKYISQLEPEELTQELEKLFVRIPEVKTYYSMELGSEDKRKKFYDKGLSKVGACFFRRGKGKASPRVQKLNAVIKNIENYSVFEHEIIKFYFDVLEICSDAENCVMVTDVYLRFKDNLKVKISQKIFENKLESTFLQECRQHAISSHNHTGK
ncbi:MAG TPA: hypothetical protein PK147_09090 [Saprospiraceae bacterium]|nr:hypothetical protein [Saprospiraceae bacterium]